MRRKPPFVSESLRAQFKAIVVDILTLVPKGAHVNYVVIDPTVPDPGGVFPGLPIYTGQSADVGQRILAHLRHAAVVPHDPGPLYERMATLIHSGTMPIFRILQVHRTRAQAIVAETTWAQRLLRSGARLLNIAPDQSRILTPASIRRMQRVGLFGLSLVDADVAGLGLRVSCRGGCTTLTIQPRALARRYREHLTLRSVRRRMSHCHVCGCPNGFRLLVGQSSRRKFTPWPLVS
ncbi:hypothetical protein [Novosphingobium fuchskuhlense]|uniref:hypothetical protein n=1 Tax=Novosphingobium fuchskuhlense TaxID=1117702 RepID=UPI0012E3654B|nr:hypothetical protein [Novosphingobium fuchskuhlense]